MATNPRYKNGALRRKYRQRFKAMGAPCGICGGRLGGIRYDEPSNSKYPLSFVIDEIRPVSKWKEYGYSSAAEAAQDWQNLQPAHWICNARKGNKTDFALGGAERRQSGEKNFSLSAQDQKPQKHKPIFLDGKW